jgi:hypothetical protein
MLTHDRLLYLLTYDPVTGLFRWRNSTSSKTTVGKIAGTTTKRGYVAICLDYKLYYAHRLAWFYVHGVWPKDEIDHKDRCKSNNWLDNLREAHGTQNQANRNAQARNATGYKGVTLHKGRYMARMAYRGKQMYLGRYDTPEEAAAARSMLAVKLAGEFAT